MTTKITDVFRQQKPFAQQAGSSSRGQRKEQNEQQRQASGAAAAAAADDDFSDPDLAPEERLLRQFDLDSKYGPCTGMTRMERWQRAERFGLNPPTEVKQLLEGMQGPQRNANLWEGRL